MNLRSRKTLVFWTFVTPILLFYTLFFIIPFMMGAMYSFTDWDGVNDRFHFVGLDNYMKIAADSRFLHSARFTFSYSALFTFFVNAFALMAALLLNMKLRTRNFLRGLLFAPNILNLVTIGFVWQFILGTLTSDLFLKTGWPIFEISFLNDKDHVLFSVTFIRVWQAMGYFMVIYLAGLQMIPADIREAAIVEGAGKWIMFKRITFPLLLPALNVCVFISLIQALRIFPVLLTLTGGGPGYASESIALNIYRTGFEYNLYGYSSAKAIFYSFIIFLVSTLQYFTIKRKEAGLS